MIAGGFALYLLVIAAIAVVAWRRTRDIADYLLGGRRTSPWVAALSAGASDMSGWLLLGLPGLAVIAPASAAWTAAGLLVGTWLNWRLVAQPLREASASLGALTLPDFLARRFPRQAGPLRVLTALTIVVFFLLYTSAGLVAGGKLFNTVFGLAYGEAVVLGALLILAYTLCGGFLAVTWTDAFQALLMSAALLLVSGLLVAAPPPAAPTATVTSAPGPAAVVSALAWGLGYFGQPHILARFMALAAPARAARARHIAVSWTGLGLVTAVVIGSAGAGLVGAGDDPERVFMLAVADRFPPWLAGFCLAAILAAVMSTADSQLLVTAAALAEDLLPRAGQGSAARRLRNGRIAVAVVAVAACALALDPESGVFALVARAWAGFGATLGPVLLIALYARRASGRGAVAGLLGGAVVVSAWPLLPGDGFGVYELLPGFVAALALNLGVNRLQGRAEDGPA